MRPCCWGKVHRHGVSEVTLTDLPAFGRAVRLRWAKRRWGRALLDADTGRIDGVTALGLDEILMFRSGPYREKHWGTTVVDARRGKLGDIVAGRSAEGATRWIQGRTSLWRRRVRWAVMDLSGPYRKAFTTALPKATQVADPFHVVKLANSTVDDVRRRVQNETTGGRGTKHDPLYRIRRLLLQAAERVTQRGNTKLRGLLAAGDPRGEVRDAWHAKETLRMTYRIGDHELALEALDELAGDLRDETFSPELNKLGRTLRTWRAPITNWHRSRVSNGRIEGTILWSVSEGVVDVVDGHMAGCRGRVLWSVSLESAMLLAA